MPIDPRELRNALGCFTTGVCVVTAIGVSGAPFGLTVNSFASVSLDPPLVLWSLDRGSDTFADFAHAQAFTISVLAADQRDLSHKLSRKGGHSLEHVDTADQPNGVPAIAGALSSFACEIVKRLDGGDHVIFLGRVIAFSYARHGHPLVYYRGRYRGLAAPEG